MLGVVLTAVLWVAPQAGAEKVADPDARRAHLAGLREALDASPGDAALSLDFAQNMGLEGDPNAALVALRHAFAADPGNAGLVAEQARQLMAMRRTAQVVPLCEDHLKAHPDDVEVEAVMLLAQSRLPGDLSEVTERVFALIETEHGENADLLEAAARLYARYNEFENAAQTYAACLEVDPLRLMTLYDAAALEMSLTARPDRALVYMLQFAEVQPAMAPWPMIGNICSMVGELDRAEHAYAMAIELGQDRAACRTHLGNLHVARFAFERAVEVLSDGLAEDPNDVELLLTRSDAYLELEVPRPELALEDLAQAIEQAPDDPRAYRNRAVFYATVGRFEEAIDDVDVVLDLDRRDRTMRELRPRLVEAQQDAGVARRVAEMLSGYEPGFYAAIQASSASAIRNNDPMAAVHATVALAHAQGPGQRADALAQRASIYSVMGWADLAIADFESALSHDPDDMRSLLGLIDRLSGMPDRLADAEGYVARALAIDPEHIGARMARVTLLIKSDRFDEAEAVLESLSMDDELALDVLSMWSLLFEAQGFYGQAADSMAHLDEIDGLTRPGLERWMDLLKRAGRFAEAEPVAVRLTRVAPREVDAWVRLAYLRVTLGDFVGAREAIVRSDALDPRSFITLRVWGVSMWLAATRGIDDAIPYIQSLQRDNAHHFNVEQAVMWCLLLEGRPEEALLAADRWRARALPEYTVSGDDIPLRYLALQAMGEGERALSLLTDAGLDERAGRPAVRAWIRLQETHPGDYLPPEVLNDEQSAQMEQMLPFFLAMEAGLAGDGELLATHVAELRERQFDAGYANLQLIIAYIVLEQHRAGGGGD
ncbi:MAG: tetratricopeptide repeat protein [Phycisphaerales bacterium JB063]